MGESSKSSSLIDQNSSKYDSKEDKVEQKSIDLDKHPNYKDKDKLELSDVCYVEDLPQQPRVILNCRSYMVTYVKYLTYGEGVPSVDFKSDLFRTRYGSLMWDYGLRK
ncbi:hypothetical protein FXO38_26171 [Capsicum annuum]|nr:hypothetical protein FXO37_36295 [Capsicum annuum]KAF3632417.1 hypothetical protein FXO38_26171 [Capsicum annuum]